MEREGEREERRNMQVSECSRTGEEKGVLKHIKMVIYNEDDDDDE